MPLGGITETPSDVSRWRVVHKLSTTSSTSTFVPYSDELDIETYRSNGYEVIEGTDGYTFTKTIYTPIASGKAGTFKTVVSYTGSIITKKDSIGYKDPAPFRDTVAPELTIILSGNQAIGKQNIDLSDKKYDEFKRDHGWRQATPAVDMKAYIVLTHDFNMETGSVDLKEDSSLKLSYTITDPSTGASVLKSGITQGAIDVTKPVADIIDYAKLSSNMLVSVNVAYLIDGDKEAEASCELKIDQSNAYVYPILKAREGGNIKKDMDSRKARGIICDHGGTLQLLYKAHCCDLLGEY